MVLVELVVLQQGFAKHYEKTRRWRGMAAPRERDFCVWQPQNPTIYRRRGGDCAPSRVPTLGGQP